MREQGTARETPLEALDEQGLVELARGHNGEAIRIIIRRYNRRLYRVARGVLGNDSEAEDVVQETYFRAFTKLDRFRGESSLSTWLTRIALNEALGRKRRVRPMLALSVLDEPPWHAAIIPFPSGSTQVDPERSVAQREIRGILERAIDDLPRVFRAVFVLRVIEGMNIEETACLLDIKPETVKTRLHRARRLLQERLDQEIASALTDVFPFAGARCSGIAYRVLQRLGIT
jgi:RNA polymerase sigma-70 factor (ECF subfamily)